MNNAFALFCLLGPTLFLGALHQRRWDSVLNLKHWVSGAGIALFLLCIYLIFIAIFGIDGVLSHYRQILTFRMGRAFSIAFISPGFGLAIAMFPQAAAELSDHALGLARAGLLSIYAITGWGLIAYWLFYTFS